VIGDNYGDLLLKHDGCRILQAVVKYGTKEQKLKVITDLKDKFSSIITQKYAHYLASKMYFYAPTAELKQYFRLEINKDINKLVSHTVRLVLIYSWLPKWWNTSMLSLVSLNARKWFSHSMARTSSF